MAIRAAAEALQAQHPRDQFFHYIATALLHRTHQNAKKHQKLNPPEVSQYYGDQQGKYQIMFEDITTPYSAIRYNLIKILEEIEKTHPEAKKYKEELKKLYNLLIRAINKADIEYWVNNPDLAYANLQDLLRGTPLEKYLTRPEQILGLPPEEEEQEQAPIAPQIITRAVEERLPGAAYRLATLIHAAEEGKITPQQAIEYLEQLHSPHSPHGTALYNIIHHLINLYEEKVARGEPIPKPSEAIKRVLHQAGLPPYRDPEEILVETELRRINPRWITAKLNLGMPLPPSRAAKAVRILIQSLRRLENGEDPEELDTRHELTLLANIIPEPPLPAGPIDLKTRVLNPYLWETVFDIAFHDLFEKAHHLGREEEEKLLRDMKQIVAQQLKTTDKNTPYYKIIADTIKKVYNELRKKGYQDKDAAWAANVAQHLLLTLPFHAIEGPHEHPKLKALLLEGYKPEEHETPPILWGLYNFYQRINQAKTTQEKQALLARFRDSLNTLEALEGSLHRTIQTLRAEKEYEPRKIAKAFLHTIKPVSRVIR